ncbi:MAG: M24 family metallopeptidase [Deltaproteobacteria bacterium]|jgi:Xaa-Pro dipeptidase|nr:M24 family metallopeptidase [Deltaproteobacteria bacterium]
MSTVYEQLPAGEVALRHERCRTLLDARLPEAGGLLLFSPINLYYLAGTLAASALWLPLAGDPVLLVRRSLERARRESPLKHILPYRAYEELADACAGVGSPFSEVIAAEKSGLSWAAAEALQAALRARFEDAAGVLHRARAVKTPYELIRAREAGARHRGAYDALAGRLRPGMSEREVAVIVWNELMARDHAMVQRSSNSAEPSPGQISVGDSANFPDVWGGTVGGRGWHPSAPYMGNPGAIWVRESLLMVDLCCNCQGYHTDVSQLFWSGKAAAVPDAVRRAHETCVAIHERAADLLKPGNTPEQIWEACAAMADRAGYADSYMGLGKNQARFLGHGVGLTYDEFPVLARRFDEPLEPGMTLAVEPKIALPGLGLAGLESVFEISADGARSITGTAHGIVCIDG